MACDVSPVAMFFFGKVIFSKHIIGSIDDKTGEDLEGFLEIFAALAAATVARQKPQWSKAFFAFSNLCTAGYLSDLAAF